jgi:hypothetical protein
LAEKACAVLERCGLATSGEGARCAQSLEAALPRSSEGAAFDAKAAARCLDTTGLDCDASPFELNENCALVLRPVAAAGARCQRSSECVSPSLACDGVGCQATCVAAGVLGGPCFAGAERRCAPGLRCDASSHCAALGTVGVACALNRDCAPGLQCSAQGACEAGAPVGQSCPPLGTCGLDGYCDTSVSPNCQPIVALGGACQSSAQCGLRAFCAAGTC